MCTLTSLCAPDMHYFTLKSLLSPSLSFHSLVILSSTLLPPIQTAAASDELLAFKTASIVYKQALKAIPGEDLLLLPLAVPPPTFDPLQYV